MNTQALPELDMLISSAVRTDEGRLAWSLHSVAEPGDGPLRFVTVARSHHGHPVDLLFGWNAPAEASALVLSFAASAVPLTATVQHPDPASPRPTGRFVLVVDRTGRSRYLQPGDLRLEEAATVADGVLADLCRRALGATVDGPDFAVGEFYARVWLSAALDAVRSGGELGAAEVHALDPATAALATVAARDGLTEEDLDRLLDAPAPAGDWLTADAAAAVRSLGWEQMAAGLDDHLDQALAEWAGPQLRFKMAFAALPAEEMLAGRLAEVAPDAAETILTRLCARGWWAGPTLV